MNVEILVGNILDVPADILISTANPWLQMTGGVNLAIMVRPRGEFVYDELQKHIQQTGCRMVTPGTVVQTGPASLPVKYILHAVAIDPSYCSSMELVTKTIANALQMACALDARTVTLPALATGFGPLTMDDFAHALERALIHDWHPLEILKVVLKCQEFAGIVRNVIDRANPVH